MEEYHKKHGVHYNPDHMNTEPLRYLDGITEPDTPRDLVGKEQINLNDKKTLRQEIATLTYTDKDGKTKTRDLKLWD